MLVKGAPAITIGKVLVMTPLVTLITHIKYLSYILLANLVLREIRNPLSVVIHRRSMDEPEWKFPMVYNLRNVTWSPYTLWHATKPLSLERFVYSTFQEIAHAWCFIAFAYICIWRYTRICQDYFTDT